ncbi:M48 family metallopeptidase [Paralimibaculum aggregatum]|uniref:M48 family metallopeptidase n=1 Tax=Paralimibaculum aggregatum TaxID=3036245 RepID=A0ABQ6LK32_9RHOB|nr:M48 family metallopeptidase [Limibaculum sp. NKW23]GMG82539.1 M48 family metallopeptidase [Limibaculum sp. NKW23]
MTALAKYARLEAPGRFFDGISSRPLEVMVSFGARSLVIMGFDGVAVAHWPLATLKAMSDRGDRAVQLAPDLQSDERLVIEEPEMIRAIEAVCPGLRRKPADRRGISRAVLWGGGALAAVLLLVFVILPGLASQLAVLIPPERERQLGDTLVLQVRDLLSLGEGEHDFCTEPAGLAALAAMVARLEAAAPALPADLEVIVLDHPLTNAFAAPGGRIVIFRGLIDDAETPEEVAGVLAHEIGHVLYRDPTVGVLRSAGTAGVFGLLVGDVFGAAIVVAGSEALLNARYQREAEARADATALAILREAGLPATPLSAFFRRLSQRYGKSNAMLGYFASHPALGDRAEAAEQGDSLDGSAFDPVLDDAGWIALGQICSRTAETPPE